MDGQHHQCNEHELGQTTGVGEGQGGLVCCNPWGRKELDTTEQLNSNMANRKGDLAQAFPMAAGDCDLDQRSVLGPEFERTSLFEGLSHLHGSGSKAGELITL